MLSDINKIKLPRLRVLDISYNNEHRYDSLRMPDLSKINQLTSLIELKAAGNSITDEIVDSTMNFKSDDDKPFASGNNKN